MKICLEQLPDAKAFAEPLLALRFPSGTTWVASRFDDGRLAGVALFTPVFAGNSNLHVASCSPTWFTKEFCQAMFRHGFSTLSCLRLTATIPASNPASLRLAKRVGFRREGYMRGYTFGDLYIHGMLKGECSWVES